MSNSRHILTLASSEMPREDSNFRKNAAGWGVLPTRCRPCREGRAARAGGVGRREGGVRVRAAAAPGDAACARLPSPPIHSLHDGKLDY